jgi:integrase/recombinase XerD
VQAVSVSEPAISQRNLELIERYIREEKHGISPKRRNKYHHAIVVIARNLEKNFRQITKDDLQDFVDALKGDDIVNPKTDLPYEHSTKVDFLKIGKAFFKWLHPEDKEWAIWIKTGSYYAVVGPEDILTTDERTRLYEVCKTPRDRALFQGLYESAARPFEFLALNKSDVEFDQDSASFHVRRGKGGFSRTITLVQNAHPLLRNWIFNEHPLRREGDFPLWVDMSSNTSHERLQQVGLRRFVERIASAAHLNKKITPYTFRHTRLTDLAREGANEALLSQLAGWRPGSRMPAVYIHLSKRDQKPALKKLLGLSTMETPKVVQAPKTCENCQEVNLSDAKVCQRCKMALDTKTAAEMLQKESTKMKEFERKLSDYSERLRWFEEILEQGGSISKDRITVDPPFVEKLEPKDKS